ncbi:MAG: hypothetical protein U0798_13315 [Gemmataceae bacterium]
MAIIAALMLAGAAFAQVPVAPGALGGQSPLFPPAAPEEKTIILSLAEALRLAGSRPLDVMIASQQVEAASQRYDQARVLWVPNLVIGGDYFRHDGLQQTFAGDIA